MTPTISVVTPTLNASRTLRACLEAIRAQDWPRDRLEIVIADGGSRDETIEIARGSGARIVPNPLRTGEAGKAVGVRAASGDLVALIDSDDILPERDWLARMAAPFRDPEIFGAEPIAYRHERGLGWIDRYTALIGMNDPVCHFLGNYDRMNILTGRWSGIPIAGEIVRDGARIPCDRIDDLRALRGGFDYLKLRLVAGRIPTIGANGTVLRRSVLLAHLAGDYLFDIDIIGDVVAAGGGAFAKVGTDIIHLFSPDLATFVRKQRRRIRDFTFHRARGDRSYPWHRQSRIGLARFVLSAAAGFPLVVESVRGHARKPDPAWIAHPVLCWLTLWIYAGGRAMGLLRKAPPDRENWRQ
ncbi:MAG: glycosyltransferase [Planctomycetes bacterium]|nr:glycosyltransferase [Planctomycetota bacterium]